MNHRSDNEKLIGAATEAILWSTRGEQEASVDWPSDSHDARRIVEVVLDVFEKARPMEPSPRCSCPCHTTPGYFHLGACCSTGSWWSSSTAITPDPHRKQFPDYFAPKPMPQETFADRMAQQSIEAAGGQKMEPQHTPTDDEREALINALREGERESRLSGGSAATLFSAQADAILAAGFRRSEVGHD